MQPASKSAAAIGASRKRSERQPYAHACAAIATRLFIGLALEAPAIHNGAWIAALLVRVICILFGMG